MLARSEMVTAAEASVIAGIEARDVHRAFDEGLLPEPLVRSSNGQRLVARSAIVLLHFHFSADRYLSLEARRLVVAAIIGGNGQQVLGRLRALRRWRRPIRLAPGIDVFLDPSIEATQRGAEMLARARAMVEENPEILGGLPVICGTRVPVYDVAASAAAGASTERILAAYPGLTAEQIELACVYARAVPPRGRPRYSRTQPSSPGRTLSFRVVPRGAAAG